MTSDSPKRKNLDHYRQQALAWTTRQVCRAPVAVAFVCVALAVVSGIYTAKSLTFKTNRNDLIRTDSANQKLFLEYVNEFRKDEDFIVVVESPDIERNRECVRRLGDRLQQQPEVFPNVFYRVDFSALDDRLLLYLTEAQLREVEKSQEQFSELIAKLGPSRDLTGLLKNANDMMNPDRLQKEGEFEKMQPFLNSFIENMTQLGDYLDGKRKNLEGISEIFTQGTELAELSAQAKANEYLSFGGGKVLLMLVTPSGEAADFERFDRPITALREIIRETRAEFPGINLGLTGEPVLDYDEMKSSAADSTMGSILTLVAIAALFIFSYREVMRPMLAISNLVVATLWTLGYTTLVVGHLNILTVTFVVMILGLGIDFGIQILGRYEEEMSHGATVEGAIVATIQHTGNAILTGAIVTAGGFFTMCMNEFIGLSELGIIAGGGLILTFLSTITLLPALLMWRERTRSREEQYHYHAGFQRTAELERKALQYPWIILGCAAALTVWMGFSALRVRFDYNLLHMQSKQLESVDYERRLIRADARSTIFGVVMCKDLDHARERAAQLKSLDVVHDVVGPPNFVPLNQAEKGPLIESIKKRLDGVNFVTADLPRVNLGEYIAQLAALRNKMKTYSKFADMAGEKEASGIFARLIPPMDRCLKLLHKLPMAEAEEKLTSYQNGLLPEIQKQIDWLRRQRTDKPITVDDIPSSLRDRYVGKTGKLLLEIYPKENLWERAAQERFVEAVQKVAPDNTGAPKQVYYYVNLLRTSYQEAALYALGAVLVMIFLHFRSVVATLLTLIPLAVGCIWTLGWMPIHALQFNPANIIALPLTVGIGIAFGVYLVDRFRETGVAGSFCNSTGRAILLSALTTMIGFGSLIPGNHQGIATLGTLMTGGVGYCLLSALIVLPPILEIFRRKGWKL
jgi:hypothetical protein